MALSLDHPVTTLDPYATDVAAEGHRLHQLGPLVPIELDGAVRCWATADYAVTEHIFTSPDFSKDPQHWKAFTDGQIPAGWPLLPLITMKSMLNRDGADHTRLRSLLSQAFTPKRIELLRPVIEQLATSLAQDLGRAGGQVVDLRQDFAFALPMSVISHLFGVDEPSDRQALAQHYGTVISSRSTPDQMQTAQLGLGQIIGKLIQTKRTTPGDDLTSALIAAHDGEDRLNAEELAETLLLMLFAGHETSKNLITNAIRSLLEHPEQLAAARQATDSTWIRAAVEETLRWRSPIRVVMFYYARKDLTIEGVPVKAGDPVLLYIAATGRDHGRFGASADQFDVTRNDAARHLSFARGVHYCIGAPLGRMTASIALDTLFRHFDVSCASLGHLTPEWTYASNSVQALPATLTALTPA
ncbi:cytochrome P450 [Streptomyces sp. NPDC045251]|uniref:cytochrome P450 family protein n=1 Tax=unclassified Streptomyces TaxID=2593676 RepID=UPI0033CDEAFF